MTESNKKTISYKLEEGIIVLQGILPLHEIEFISLNGKKNNRRTTPVKNNLMNGSNSNFY